MALESFRIESRVLTETQGQDLMNRGQNGKQRKRMDPVKGTGETTVSGESKEDRNSLLRPFAQPTVESVASSIEAMWPENQEIPGGWSLFLLCEMPQNKSRNLAL